jgi:molecular chaperone DnaK (HSP70)
MKTSNSISPELEAKLKLSDSEIQIFVKALVSENLHLQKQLFKVEAKNVSFNNRISVLEEELKEIQPFAAMSKKTRDGMIKDLEERLKEEENIRNLPMEEVVKRSNHLKELEKRIST